MKKFLYSLAAFALVASTACQESAMTSDQIAGETTAVTINAKALASAESRAALPDESSDDLTFYLEIYKDGVFYNRLEPNETGIFITRLVSGQEFTLVAWADHDTAEADFYNTDDLTNITLTDLGKSTINSTDRDAFAGTQTETITKGTNISMVLRRPFARINVRTNDIAEIHSDALVPSHVELVYNADVYTAYSVLDAEVVGTPEAITVPATATVDTEGELSADYIFAPKDGGVVNFTASYTKNDALVTERTYASIPYKRNYQTNISGNLLTSEGVITVTVDQNWDGEIESQPYTVENASDIAGALSDAAVSGDKNPTVSVKDATDVSTLKLQEVSDFESITLAFPNSLPKLIQNLSSTPKLVIYAPNGSRSSLNVNPGADNTVYLASGSTLYTLTISTGNGVIESNAKTTNVFMTGALNLDVYGSVSSVYAHSGTPTITTYAPATQPTIASGTANEVYVN